MESKETINRVLSYIEQHLQESLSVGLIADFAGYSEYYFLRMFKKYMSMTVMEYVNKRRMLKASEDILEGMRILDAAVKYGWQSHSGFTKAFKKEFGFSPSLLRVMAHEINCLGGVVMKHAFLDAPEEHASKEELLELWKSKLHENRINIKEAQVNQIYHSACCAYEGVSRYSGDEYVTHPLNVSIVLTELNADPEVICAGMFCDVAKKGKMSLEQLKRELPPEIGQLVQKVSEWEFHEEEIDSPATLIKLAERLHNMRTVAFMSEQQRKEKAQETLQMFLPIARKLGIDKLSTELNDLALKYL